MFIITTGTHTKRRITTTKHLAFRFWFRVNHKQNTHSMRIDSNKSVRIWLLFLFNFFFAVLTFSQFATLAYPGYYAGCMRIIFTRAKLTTKGNHTLIHWIFFLPLAQVLTIHSISMLLHKVERYTTPFNAEDISACCVHLFTSFSASLFSDFVHLLRW